MSQSTVGGGGGGGGILSSLSRMSSTGGGGGGGGGLMSSMSSMFGGGGATAAQANQNAAAAAAAKENKPCDTTPCCMKGCTHANTNHVNLCAKYTCIYPHDCACIDNPDKECFPDESDSKSTLSDECQDNKLRGPNNNEERRNRQCACNNKETIRSRKWTRCIRRM